MALECRLHVYGARNVGQVSFSRSIATSSSSANTSKVWGSSYSVGGNIMMVNVYTKDGNILTVRVFHDVNIMTVKSIS